MPELPDLTVYLEALQARILDQRLEAVRLTSPFLLRTTTPPLDAAEHRTVRQLSRLGKRIVIGLEGDYWLVVHLMIAGRLHWREPQLRVVKNALAAFFFPNGTLVLTEAGSRKRASLHFVKGSEALQALDPGGLEVLECSFEMFADRLTSANHTLKRALTDPHLFSGIGNAYSDEILHDACLSPVALTKHLRPEAIRRLYESSRKMLSEWVERLREDARGRFPEKVTAFRDRMAVHGKYGKPCPRCGAKVQRIRYAENETNYCPRCQTGGKLLADRSLSRLLKEDWPRSIEQLEALTRRDPASRIPPG
jgi:formamidopyrimidine-DNA glycosylase